MISIQKSIGQGVISLISKKIIGHIKSFSVKNNKIDLIYCFNDFDGTEFSFPVKNVLSLGDDAVIIKSENNLSVSEEENSNCILGLPVISQKGKQLGLLLDLELDENFKIQNLVLQNKKILVSEVDLINEHFILLKGKYKIKNKNILKNNFNYIVKIQNENITPDIKGLPKINESVNENKPSTPAKKVAISPNLIGKTVTKNIYYKDKILIKMGTIITQKVAELALISGNLPALIASSI